MRHSRLLEPTRIGQMELKNRIVMPGMATSLGDGQGGVSEQDLAYFEARAKGGVGLIIVGVTSVDFSTGRLHSQQLCLDDDKFIPGMSQLAQVIKKHGAKAAVQLHHGGRNALPQFVEMPLAPSPIAAPGKAVPRELTVGEIADIVTRFGQAARRAKDAGFDGVEIHGAHGYLIANFLSAASNARQDAYGGELENRARILLEIIGAIRESVGGSFSVWCRINGREFGVDHGITLKESQQVARIIERTGVNAIHVSAQGWPPAHSADGPLVHFAGHLVPLAEEIKKAVDIPIIAVGRISPELGEQVLKEKKADFIAMGRPLIADPELPNKLMSGRYDDVRPCIYCGMCADHIVGLEGVCCTVNAAVGIEHEYRIEPAEKPEDVLVVGGGPGGMEAARIAAQRGHRVRLYDKRNRLGGGLNLVGVLNERIEILSSYLVDQLERSGAQVFLGEELTAERIKAIKPDVAILAMGTKLVPPAIPGIDRDSVITGTDIREMMTGHLRSNRAPKLLSVQGILWALGSFVVRSSFRPGLIRWLSRIWMPFGRRIIIIGGDRVGCETAEFLAERGRKVTILDSQEGMMGQGLAYYIKDYMLYRLGEMGVAMLSGVKYEQITDEGLVITTQEGERQTIEADTIVLAIDAEPNTELSASLQGVVPEVYLVGDCLESRGILEAIADGSRIARAI